MNPGLKRDLTTDDPYDNGTFISMKQSNGCAGRSVLGNFTMYTRCQLIWGKMRMSTIETGLGLVCFFPWNLLQGFLNG